MRLAQASEIERQRDSTGSVGQRDDGLATPPVHSTTDRAVDQVTATRTTVTGVPMNLDGRPKSRAVGLR